MTKANVLVVDDDPDIRLMLSTVLEAEDYNVSTAKDGVECLELIDTAAPDLLILDLLMPRKDGFAVIRELRESAEHADLPVLVLTAVPEEASRRRYELEVGASMDVQDYVVKRIRPPELLRRVEKLLKGRTRSATKQLDILLVDDDPDFVTATRLVLLEAGYGVRTALSGEEGLAMARRKTPDLIVLDVIMPDLDGFTVCERCKADPELRDVPVMMLTSFAGRVSDTSVAVRQGMNLEAEDYVDKPVRPAELLRRVDKLVARLRPADLQTSV